MAAIGIMKAASGSGPLAIHASAVVIGEDAVLLRGPSGAGKTALALALIATGRARGRFARLVADDRVLLQPVGDRLIVMPHPAIAGRIERRFVGIAPIAHETRAVARLVVDLEPAASGLVRRLPDAMDADLAGIRLRRIVLPGGHPGAAEAVLHILAESSV